MWSLLFLFAVAETISKSAYNLYIQSEEAGWSQQKLEFDDKTKQYHLEVEKQIAIGAVTYRETLDARCDEGLVPVAYKWTKRTLTSFRERSATFEVVGASKNLLMRSETLVGRKRERPAPVEVSKGTILSSFLPQWILGQPLGLGEKSWKMPFSAIGEEEGNTIIGGVEVEVADLGSQAAYLVRVSAGQLVSQWRLNKKAEVFSVYTPGVELKAEMKPWEDLKMPTTMDFKNPSTPKLAPNGSNIYKKDFGTPQGKGIHLKGSK